MGKGQALTLATGTADLLNTQSREEKSSAAIFNPNDGVVYVAINRRADSNTNWDHIFPSQSYGIIPGPWQSLGLYFLDQSGAGRPGQLIVYESDIRIDIPEIHAIGRALQAQVSSMDITQGSQPANPSVGVTRLWGDVSGLLWRLLSSGDNDEILTRYAGVIGTNEIASAVSLTNPRLLGDIDVTATSMFVSWLRLKNAATGLYNEASAQGLWFRNATFPPEDYASSRFFTRGLLHQWTIGSGSTTSTSYQTLSGSQAITVPHKGLLAVFGIFVIRASTTSGRPQVAIRIGSTDYEGLRLETAVANIYRPHPFFYMFNDVTGGSLTVIPRFKNFDANGVTITVDGGFMCAISG